MYTKTIYEDDRELFYKEAFALKKELKEKRGDTFPVDLSDPARFLNVDDNIGNSVAVYDNKDKLLGYYIRSHARHMKSSFINQDVFINQVLEFVASGPKTLMILLGVLLDRRSSIKKEFVISNGAAYLHLIESFSKKLMKDGGSGICQYSIEEEKVRIFCNGAFRSDFYYKLALYETYNSCSSNENPIGLVHLDNAIAAYRSAAGNDTKDFKSNGVYDLIRANKKRILNIVNGRNLETLRKNFGTDPIQYEVYHGIVMKMNSLVKFEEKLKETGVKLMDGDSENELWWLTRRQVSLKAPAYGISLSYYRHLTNMAFKDAKKLKHAKKVNFLKADGSDYQKYPVVLGESNHLVGYNTSYRFDYLVSKNQFLSRMARGYTESDGFEQFFLDRLIAFFGLTEAKKIAESMKDLPLQDRHNYENGAQNIYSSSYYTKGAFRSFLSLDSLEAEAVGSMLRELPYQFDIEQVRKAQKEQCRDLSKKEMRKTISSLLRRKKIAELGEYVTSIKTRCQELRAQVNKPEPLPEESKAFIERVNVYAPYVTEADLVSLYGYENAAAIVKGEYTGIFEPAVFYPEQNALARFIDGLLCERTRSAKRLYTALSQVCPVKNILNGDFMDNQLDQVLNVLQNRGHDVRATRKQNRIQLKIEPKCSPEYLTAGDATVCCMRMNSGKAVKYALSKGIGVINAYYKDKVIANSVIWINENQNCLVFDNIEVHPNYIEHNVVLKDLFLKAGKYLVTKHSLDFAVQGSSYNDLDLFDESPKAYVLEGQMKDVEKQAIYSDSYLNNLLDVGNKGLSWLENRIIEANTKFRTILADTDSRLMKGLPEFYKRSKYHGANSDKHWVVVERKAS